MSTRDVVRQLHAAKVSNPVARYSTLHLRTVENPFMVAFVRMAGESRPWGIVFGRLLDKAPKVLTAGDGRNREAVSQICEEFGTALLQYCRAEGHTFNPITKDNIEPSELPQIWVPGARHVEMFHHLEYAFWRVRKGDDRTQPLTAFARLSGWLFREAGRTGQQQIVDASKALLDAFVFPSDSISLGNLTTSVAWFNEDGTLAEKRLKVRAAGEQRVSPTIDPLLDKAILGPLVDERADLLKAGKSLEQIERKIHDALEPELMIRWDSMKDAYKIFANDTRRENQGVTKLVKASMEKFVWQFQRVERQVLDPDLGPAFTPHPETDFHGSAAASTYFQMAAADTAFIATLIHDDKELQNESLAQGRAFLAKINEVHDEGVGNKKVPIWTFLVETGELLRLREGERYSLLGNQASTIYIRSVEVLDDSQLLVEGEWYSPKIKELNGPIFAKPLDQDWVGHTVLFVPTDTSGLDAQKGNAVWKAKDGIGAWLTHGKAPASIEGNIIDDITQLESGV
jgi:hypothetical protein